MTRVDISLDTARRHLATVLQPGDTLHLIRRRRTPRGNLLVEVIKPPQVTLGPWIAPFVLVPYIWRPTVQASGLLMKRGHSPEAMIATLATHLYGDADQLKVTWR